MVRWMRSLRQLKLFSSRNLRRMSTCFQRSRSSLDEIVTVLTQDVLQRALSFTECAGPPLSLAASCED